MGTEMFPAPAGMTPPCSSCCYHAPYVPRACGDDPIMVLIDNIPGECSPRLRG